MNQIVLEASQMLDKHPVTDEKDSYKQKYIGMLEYFAEKYSAKNPWAEQTLRLYKKKFFGNENKYQSGGFDLSRDSKSVLGIKFRPFRFFSYRYCFIIDCIFICAYGDKKKAAQIFDDLSTLYHRWHQKKIRLLFDSLYDLSIATDEIEQIQFLKSCWDKNSKFIEKEPIMVLVTANMSAGKSTLLNALVGKKVNKTRNEVCTAKIHTIVDKPYEDGFSYELDFLLELDADYQTLMEDNENNNSSNITVGTFFRTLDKTPKRLWLIDTPGVNSFQDANSKSLSEDMICNSKPDLLIYLLNGENIGTDDDKKHLIFVSEHYHGKIIFVVNKLDRFRQAEDSVKETLNKVVSELTDIGFKEPNVVPLSSYAAYLAKMKIFNETLDDDEQDEYELMSRKMKKPEYQLDSYYPETIKPAVAVSSDDAASQLLLHSGLLHLEKIIYNMR